MQERASRRQLLIGGTILPQDGVTPHAEALVVDEDGRVAGLGNRSEMEALAGRTL